MDGFNYYKKCPKCESFVDTDKYCRPLSKTCSYCGYKFLTDKEYEEKYGNGFGLELEDVIKLINKALFKFEQFSKGARNEYEYINMNDLFTQLFIEARKNYTLENCHLIGDYWKLLNQYQIDYDKGKFESKSAYKNEAFIKNCEEFCKLSWDRVEDFCEFSLDDEFEEKKFSILDISNSQSEVIETKEKIPIEEQRKLMALAKQYCKKPHSKYNEDEVLFILKKTHELKHQSNVSALIRNIQNEKDCPDTIKYNGDFFHSNKHVKRQRKVIDFYDKETGNKRK